MMREVKQEIKKEEPKNLRDVRENVLNQKREIVLKSVFQKEVKEEDKYEK